MTGTKPDERIRTPMHWTAERPGGGFTTGDAVAAARRRLAAGSTSRPRTATRELVLSTYRDARSRSARRIRHCGTARRVLVDGDAESVIGCAAADAPTETVLVVANPADEPRQRLRDARPRGRAAVRRHRRDVARLHRRSEPGTSPPRRSRAGGGLDGYQPDRRARAARACYVIELGVTMTLTDSADGHRGRSDGRARPRRAGGRDPHRRRRVGQPASSRSAAEPLIRRLGARRVRSRRLSLLGRWARSCLGLADPLSAALVARDVNVAAVLGFLELCRDAGRAVLRRCRPR